MLKNNLGKILIGAGLILLLGSLFLLVYNHFYTKAVENRTKAITDQLEKKSKNLESDLQEFKKEQGEPKENQMITMTIGNYDYIGIIEIPDAGIKLPIQATWSYDLMKVSPCRYKSSPEENGFMIAGYPYTHQLGILKKLKEGTRINFRNIEGKEYNYIVAELETDHEKGAQGMAAENWDLTIFTCPVSSSTRVIVRCRKSEN